MTVTSNFDLMTSSKVVLCLAKHINVGYNSLSFEKNGSPMRLIPCYILTFFLYNMSSTLS